MVETKVPTIQVNEQPVMVKDHCVDHAIHLFMPIEPCHVGIIIIRVVDFDECPINEHNTILRLWKLVLRVAPSLIISHWILSPITSLMQDAMKIALWHSAFLFHVKNEVA